MFGAKTCRSSETKAKNDTKVKTPIAIKALKNL